MSKPVEARLVVVHRVPGRVRVAVQPAERMLLVHLVKQAPRIIGVKGSEVGASRHNLVVRFDPNHVTEDNLLMRLGLALSARLNYAPVQVVRERRTGSLDRGAVITGGLAAAAVGAAVVAPLGALAGVLGWSATLCTVATVGNGVVSELMRGTPRPEGLSLLRLMSRLGSADRSYAALLTWLLYHGNDLAEQVRGGTGLGVELRPVMLKSGVGDDREGTHMEIMTRPVQTQGAIDGRLLTPSTLATATIGYLVYSLQQAWSGSNSAN
jgi:hypothetical protein